MFRRKHNLKEMTNEFKLPEEEGEMEEEGEGERERKGKIFGAIIK